jgi:hypothetical protein
LVSPWHMTSGSCITSRLAFLSFSVLPHSFPGYFLPFEGSELVNRKQAPDCYRKLTVGRASVFYAAPSCFVVAGYSQGCKHVLITVHPYILVVQFVVATAFVHLFTNLTYPTALRLSTNAYFILQRDVGFPRTRLMT